MPSPHVPTRRAVTAVALAAALAAGPTAAAAAPPVRPGPVTPVGYDATTDPSSLRSVAAAVGADHLWAQGITGAGVDVAVVDTGVGRGGPLDTVDHGRSFRSDPASTDPRPTVDGNGHGTHVAGIIGAGDGSTTDDPSALNGIAPDVRIVPVKAAHDDGTGHLGQVMAALEWVLEHRTTGGRDIRVLNLSMAAPTADRPTDDALAHAVARVWEAGIVVVAAAGNDGAGSPLVSPAYEPRVISVGALATNGTVAPDDDVPAGFSSGGTAGATRPDLWAPGSSIPSVLAPGSWLAGHEGASFLGDGLVRGSGTSQAAAVVAGAAALLLQQRPELTPDQVASLLHASAAPMTTAEGVVPRARLDLAAAAALPTPDDGPSAITEPTPGWSAADPATWLHEAGDVTAPDVLVRPDGARWVGARWVGARWVGARWVGARWVGARWVGARWVGVRWTGARWVGARWVASDWS